MKASIVKNNVFNRFSLNQKIAVLIVIEVLGFFAVMMVAFMQIQSVGNETKQMSYINTPLFESINSIDEKVQRGIQQEKDQVFYHTGPHHDDIMLGMMPHIIHLIREPSNKHVFTNMTSGFTSVTNGFLEKIINTTLSFFKQGKIKPAVYQSFKMDDFVSAFNLFKDRKVMGKVTLEFKK